MPTPNAVPTKVITGEVRCSYVHLDKPAANPSNPLAEPKFSLVALIPKSDTATVEKIRAAQQAALEIGKAKKFGGEIPSKWKDTLRDGDAPEEADQVKKNPEYKGHWFISVGNTRKPGVVDPNLQQIMDATELYSGMYARLALNAYPFNTQGSKGVSFGLDNVMKTRDGESLGGTAAAAEDDFAEFGQSLL